MSDKSDVINIKECKIFDCTSWYHILFGSVIVWFLSCNKACSDFILTQKNNMAVMGIMVYLIFLAYAIYNKKDTKTIIGLILLGGFLIRAYYTIAAPYGITKHDLGYFTGLNTDDISFGNTGYIDYIYKNGHLFDFDPRMIWSFYQPPCFYIAAAAALKITTMFNVAEPLCYEGIQFVTLLFSSLTAWTFYRIIKEFLVSDKLLVLITAFISFHPFFMVMSVTLTNDCMAMYFMALAVWFTIRWQKSPVMKNIVVIAFAVGMAMFSKLNAAIISFGIGTVFIYVFWINRKEFKKYIFQFAVFLLICAPVGLFIPIRNYVKFDVPFLYIQELAQDNPQLIKNAPVFSRLGLPSLKQMSYAFPNFNPEIEQNVWIQALRTSLFDELIPDVGSSLFGANALIFLWIAIILAIFMNVVFVWNICKDPLVKIELRVFMAVEYLAMLISYAKFCISEPFICTMNYRYISISLIFPLIGTAMWLQNRHGKETGNLSRNIKNILICGMLCFSVMAVIIDMNFISWSGTLL